MYRLRAFLFLLLTSLVCSGSVSATEIIDRIVAEVNNDIVTLSELNEQGEPIFQQILAKAPANLVESEIQRARSEILTDIIDQLLIRQEAKKYDIIINNNDIDHAIDSIISENNITTSQFKEELTRMGTTLKKYRENLTNQMLRSRVINIEIRSKLVITEEKIKEYYDANYIKKNSTTEGYHILQIGFGWGNDKKMDSPEKAKQLAEKVKKAIIDGEDFRTLAKTYSDLPSAEDGGDIGTFNKNEMAPYMVAAISSMHPGETSGVIETPSGFQILKLLSFRQGDVSIPAPLDSVKNDIKEVIYKQEMEKDYLSWMEGLRERAYIKKKI